MISLIWPRNATLKKSESLSYELNPRAVVGILKQKKINLKKLYDYLAYYYPKESKDEY